MAKSACVAAHGACGQQQIRRSNRTMSLRNGSKAIVNVVVCINTSSMML